MIAFIDDQRRAYGVEPICRELPIAPSTDHAHAARRTDPLQAPPRFAGTPPFASRAPPCSGWSGSTIVALLKPIGHIPPAEAEANVYADLESRAVAA